MHGDDDYHVAKRRWPFFQEELKRNPDDIDLLFEGIDLTRCIRTYEPHNRAESQAYHRKWGGLALSYAERIVEIDPEARIRKSLPYFFYHAGKYDEAIESFRALDLLNPTVKTWEDSLSVYDLADILMRMGELREAERVFQIIVDAGNGEESFNLCNWVVRMGRDGRDLQAIIARKIYALNASQDIGGPPAP